MGVHISRSKNLYKFPFHINHGTDDYGVPLNGSELLMEQSQTPMDEKVLNIIQDGYHALLTQSDADETMDHQIQWILTMIQRQKEK